MYTPRSFRVDDPDLLGAFMQAYSFCTLITAGADDSYVSHVPVLIDRDQDDFTLLGHLARPNPHASQLNGRRATAIFHGPHSYISPHWYADSREVPTWNYASVHTSGVVQTFDDSASLSELVDRMVEFYEALYNTGWDRQLPDDYRQRQLTHIVGFRLSVERLSGKFKLGQNRSLADQDGMLTQMQDSANSDSRELAAFIKRYRRSD
ncbi:MAG: FMN-binding negative transcriptional regulator [Gammaproteobacteria bacterium]|nr:FMN-binding negative transcriptional regulator [Gammaproteobacteria bacterium]